MRSWGIRALAKPGRPRKSDERSFEVKLEVAWRYLGLGLTATEIARSQGVSRRTIYREIGAVERSKDPRAVALIARCRGQLQDAG
jgi:hypothetical protein